jgi:dihydroorotate dehydrogenase
VIYDAVRRLLFQTPPERIHHLVFGGLRGSTASALTRAPLRRALAPRDPILASTLFGVHFPGPLGLAAGFDKDGLGLNAWGALGFGYAEVGTVTAKAQPGNPEPRLFRLPQDRGVLNRMGFNNAGAGQLALRLARHRPDVPIGVNIGKSKVTPPEQAAQDYAASARLLGPLASYLVVNVSSPNTPGLRDLQAVESLRPILAAVLAETSTPVLVKIAPDLSDEDVDAVADLSVEMSLTGIVATNTTVSRAGLRTPGAADLGPGGVSGPPLARRALEVLRRLYTRVGDRQVLIGVGGIETADDAWERITAGASLLQGYTGFIYGGGLWAKHIHDGIANRLHAGGFPNLSAAVGSAHRPGGLR